MKSRTLTCITAMTLLAVLAIPVRLSGQKQEDTPKHHHYKLIDLGTLGGPQSYLNDAGGVSSVVVLNNQGEVAGWADTPTPDPNAPNFCFDEGCFVAHAFRWHNGAKSDLGVLPGGANSAANWISESGLIAGAADNGEIDPLIAGLPEARAVLWQHGKITDLGVLPEGGYESVANSVNSRGQVVGFALNSIPDSNSMASLGFQTRAFLWENGVMQDLGTLKSGTDAQALLVNERGQIVGLSYTSSEPSAVCSGFGLALTTGSFSWDKQHGMVDLGGFGGTCTVASGLNDRGQAVGESWLPGDQASRAFLWDPATGLKKLDTLGGDFAEAEAINNAGDAVGGSYLEGDAQIDAALWRNDQTIDLGTVDGDTCAFAFSINAQRQVVGSSNCFSNSQRGFLWEDGGPMVELNTIVSPSSNLYVTIGLTINDRGEIAADAVLPNGDQHAVLLIPCDENHSNVAGCDYSLVDAATADIRTRSDSIGQDTSLVSPGLETTETSTEIQRSLSGANRPANQMFRRRFGWARSQRTPQASALTATATTSLTITSGAPPNGTVGLAYGSTGIAYKCVVSFVLGIHQVCVVPCLPGIATCTGLPLCRGFFPSPCTRTIPGFEFTASGEVPPFRWNWTAAAGSSIPPGLTLDNYGVISGTPTLAGTYHVIVTVTDPSSPLLNASASYRITILE